MTTRDKAIELARQAGFAFGMTEPVIMVRYIPQDAIERLITLARNEAIEEVSDAWNDTLQSDLENGVKFLNEIAADNLRKSYPKLSRFGETIESLKDETT